MVEGNILKPDIQDIIPMTRSFRKRYIMSSTENKETEYKDKHIYIFICTLEMLRHELSNPKVPEALHESYNSEGTPE